MNLELFEKVKKYIREEPRRLNMEYYFCEHPSSLSGTYKNIPPCGTTSCIAGTAIILSDPDWRSDKTHPALRACDLLQIPTNRRSREGIIPLFFVRCWPANLRSKYHQTANPYTEAEIACEAIDAFIRGEF